MTVPFWFHNMHFVKPKWKRTNGCDNR
ncbi:hypothetical protein KL86PLE_100524 [uncultured Pleomorphomonas sp.]|uniref:Uncharacterized protein n=1 Tax=uncultured Pleomorphomonas sp. TaxID=442121 RepID=A0A212L409_9HYPH|nr:hypothetical protein KL86PLE_100524 [uncultured Pleomorphomonas sp.]